MLVALRMLIARSVSDLSKKLRVIVSDGPFGGNESVEWGVYGFVLLAQIDVA